MCTVNSSAMHPYKNSLKNLSNASTNLILEDIWREHVSKVDDQSPNGIGNLSETIKQLIPNKHVVRNSKNWKFSLRSISDSQFSGDQCKNDPKCNLGVAINLVHFNAFQTNIRECRLDVIFDKQSTHNSQAKQLKSKELEQDVKKHCDFIQQTSMSTQPQVQLKHSKKWNFEQSNFGFNRELEENKSGDHNGDQKATKPVFKTARDQLLSTNPTAKKSLGTARKAPSKFVSPMMTGKKEEQEDQEVLDERLKHIDPKMVEFIMSEVIDNGTPVEWDDIAGLQTAKTVIQEAVVWPLLRPDIFTGLRRPPKGVLLFGPPGTGKTLIGKCVASQCSATFFNISASSLTSKWIGDGEKMVRALFAVARTCQPAVVFVDEIDSLLMQRSDAEHEATRRIKTEFLVQFDGAVTGEEDRILVIGATNRPQELDEAARRRLVKRLYIPLPDCDARKQIVSNLMHSERHELTATDIEEICRLSDGYSGADMRSLCSEAAMGPIRSVPLSQIVNVHTDQVRAVSMEDFRSALRRVRPSVSRDDLEQYVRWNATFGFANR